MPTYRYYVDEKQTEPFEAEGYIGNGKKIFDEGQGKYYIHNATGKKEGENVYG